jgi:hypothetical protein
MASAPVFGGSQGAIGGAVSGGRPLEEGAPRGRIVFAVQHVEPLPSGFEEVRKVGVYSSAEAAQQAISRIRLGAGFSSFPDAFYVDEYELDVDHWANGFEPDGHDDESGV